MITTSSSSESVSHRLVRASGRHALRNLRRAAQSLGADVVHINFEIGFDVMGFDSIFFNIVLTDEASRPARLRFVAQHVALTLMNQLKTDENGVHAYFNFRSQSEVASIKDPAWA